MASTLSCASRKGNTASVISQLILPGQISPMFQTSDQALPRLELATGGAFLDRVLVAVDYLYHCSIVHCNLKCALRTLSSLTDVVDPRTSSISPRTLTATLSSSALACTSPVRSPLLCSSSTAQNALIPLTSSLPPLPALLATFPPKSSKTPATENSLISGSRLSLVSLHAQTDSSRLHWP